MTIDEAKADVKSVEVAIQKMLEELQIRTGLGIDDVRVSIIKSGMLSTPSPVSYIGRVKICVSL